MLILLPPSEKKNIPAKGPRLILTSLSFSKELSVPREIALKKYGKKITEAPTAAAINIYTGVLYQSLDWQQLSAAAKKRGEKSILIVSALFGVLAPGDKIPSYKSKIEPRLWRKPLADALGAQEDELIVDCRSSTYSTVWSADPQRCVEVRVFQKKAGKLSVITHMSKKYRGELANLLISQSKNPKTAEELCAIASKKFECKLHRGSATKTSKLDLIISV